MSDLLDDLVKASRDVPVQHDEADETRRRILAAANHQARTTSRRRLAPWVLPLVAALVATGALAAGPLGVTQAIFGPAPSAPAVTTPAVAPPKPAVARSHAAAQPTDTSSPETAPPEPPASAHAAAAALPSPVASAAQLAPPTSPALVPDATAEDAPPRLQRPRSPLSPPLPPPVGTVLPARGGEAPPGAVDVATRPDATLPINGAVSPDAKPPVPPSTDPSDALYRTAHDTHFRGGSPSAAIEAWDRYLAAAPRGRFAVEARYNRALALLKAGRRSEGLAALEPFASGSFGNYRRDEAQRLLGAARDGGAP